MQSKGNHILVFVHGFNVSFEDAARRTAQMASDLKFDGAPVFYSWPSQADWWKYRVDEKNVALSVDQLKSFLLAIAERSDADTINLVAHSMGNRVLTDALKEIDVAATERKQLFNQVILAAPDIDADIFRQRIAPAIVTKAKHVTLYASSKDLALVASRTFNSGDPRAGDAGGNLVVYPGIETIDVSAIDSSLLGHSYYGSSVSVLSDIEFLLRDQPASSRKFLAPVSLQGDLTYWLFEPPRISRRSDNRYETR
jgi:esterase/lipase superfamily enzyme